MPWTDVPDVVSGDIFTEAMWDLYIKDDMNLIQASRPTDVGYGSRTTDITISATTEATAQTICTANSVTLSATSTVWISMFIPASDGLADVYFYLFQGSTSLGIMAWISNPQASSIRAARRLSSVAAGTYTWSIRARRSSANSTLWISDGSAGSEGPAYMRVIKAAQGWI